MAIHDVAPATWPACAHLLQALAAVAPIPVTLLVVPHYHRGRPALDDAAFAGLMTQRLQHGDELALHGWRHLDEAPAPAWHDYPRRRWYTAGEGEFSALSSEAAGARLDAGIRWFADRHWPLHGFVAPAWLMSAGTWAALSSRPFSYTSTLQQLQLLPEQRRIPAPCLTFSCRSRLRRTVSHSWLDWLYRRTRDVRVLRFGLHPADASHPAVVAHWQRLLAQVLNDRRAVTKYEASQLLRMAPARQLAVG